MNRYTLAPSARDDLHSIWDYIATEHDRPETADRLIETLYDKFVRLAENPFMGEVRQDLADIVKDIRSFSVGNYVIYYHVTQGRVRVGRILHGARDARVILSEDES